MDHKEEMDARYFLVGKAPVEADTHYGFVCKVEDLIKEASDLVDSTICDECLGYLAAEFSQVGLRAERRYRA